MTSETATAQQHKSAATRAKVLAGAAALIRRDGVHRLTLDGVAAEAGMSKGGLSYHFRSKDQLVAALLEETLRRTDDGLQQCVTDDRPGSFARAYLEYVRRSDQDLVDNAQAIFAAAADGDHLGSAVATFADWQDRLVTADGIDPDIAMLARIVGDGLWLIDLFGLAAPDAAQRSAVIDLVLGLIDGSELAAQDSDIESEEECA